VIEAEFLSNLARACARRSLAARVASRSRSVRAAISSGV
jgi:hypothetical protein